MYVYTTGEYANGESSLRPDGAFYFKRSWEGTKKFRLTKKEDNIWITTPEFPLCIRSYWVGNAACMPDNFWPVGAWVWI